MLDLRDPGVSSGRGPHGVNLFLVEPYKPDAAATVDARGGGVLVQLALDAYRRSLDPEADRLGAELATALG